MAGATTLPRVDLAKLPVMAIRRGPQKEDSHLRGHGQVTGAAPRGRFAGVLSGVRETQ